MASPDMNENQRRQPGLTTIYTFNENRKRPLRVLLAEDSTFNHEIMQNILTKLGCIMDIAMDGEEAVSAVRKAHYDLILMDLRMPRMDGLTAVAAIRRLPDNQGQIPIIALTADLSEHDKQRFHAQGVHDILIKPIDIVKLKEAMRRLTKFQTSSLFGNANALEAAQQLQATQAVPPEADTEIVHLFLYEAAQRLDALREGLRQGDSECIAREAHTLKGASAYFHADSMQEPAAKLEQMASSGNLEGARPVFNLLEQAYAALQTKLQKQLRTNACL
jgi:CheY-like chemotaxis protein/HPt (histidine-containing phosphotransfer) domain-containing protein